MHNNNKIEFKHKSVLLEECIAGLDIKPDGVYIDGTAGGAGHSCEIAKKLSQDKGVLLALDKDPDAIKVASSRLEQYPSAKVVQVDFSMMEEALKLYGIEKVDGILLDIGVSSYQLDNGERGFSYRNDAPLDMRMKKEGMSAKDIVNTYSVQELSRILTDYGEEKFSYSIAKNIDRYRNEKDIETTLELVDIIKRSMPEKAKRDANPARKTFQALRIEVNRELEVLEIALKKGFELLNKGGRMCIITFHSLEDRIVKNYFNELAQGCICDKNMPVCICGNKPKVKKITRKPIIASEYELASNSRSRSAKLRIIEKL